jgi:hypothetical protein
MSHGGSGGAPPRGGRNTCTRSIDGSPAHYRALATGQGGACCSTARYRRDDRSPAAREQQLIVKAADQLEAYRPAHRRDALSVEEVPRRLRVATQGQLESPSVCRSRLKRPAAVFAARDRSRSCQHEPTPLTSI